MIELWLLFFSTRGVAWKALVDGLGVRRDENTHYFRRVRIRLFWHEI